MMGRATIVKEIKESMQSWWDLRPTKEKGPISAYCMHWAFYTVGICREFGVNAQIQAGSAYWRRLPDEMDQGTDETTPWFGYNFEPDKVIDKLARGMMPEIHVWAAVVETHTIIDLTSGFFPEQAKRLLGYEWLYDHPPEYLWVDADNFPENARYYPDFQAISLVYQILGQAL